MTKRISQTEEKLFDIDLESLFGPEFFKANDNNENTNDFNVCSEKKKVKTNDDIIPLSTHANFDSNKINKTEKVLNKTTEESEDVSDVKSFFTHFGNDIGKSMEVKKARLGKFNDAIISVYHTKITEMMLQQEEEMNNFKKQSNNNFEEHLKKFEDESYKFKLQENKLIKMLEQQIKLMETFSSVQKEWIKNFRELHKLYVQNYSELLKKHKNEALNIKESIQKDILFLQNKFLMEVKREEMLNIKKYLSDVYF